MTSHCRHRDQVTWKPRNGTTIDSVGNGGEKKGTKCGDYWAMNCVDFVERELRQPVRTKSGLVGRIHRHRHPPLRRSEPIVRFDDSCPITELLLVESSKGVVESGRGTKEKQIRFCNILQHFGTFWNGRGVGGSQKCF